MKICNYINGKILKYIESKNVVLGGQLRELEKYGDNPNIRWTLGGRSGGNCWDGSKNSYELSAEEKPEFTTLDDILEIISPNISYLQYKKLLKSNIVKYTEDTNRGYYGNYEDYAMEEFSLNELIAYLLENNLIIEEALKE